MTRQERNAAAVASLHPEFRPLVEKLLDQCEADGQALCIVQAYRSTAEQSKLYAQGRSAPGPIVTNARPGRSYHEYGLAVDLVDFAASGDREKYEPEDFAHTNYVMLAGRAAMLGMQWGGRWRNADRPHIEWHPSLADDQAFELEKYLGPDGRLPNNFFDGKF